VPIRQVLESTAPDFKAKRNGRSYLADLTDFVCGVMTKQGKPW